MIKDKSFSRIIAIVVVATILLQTSTGAFASQIFFGSTNKAFSKEISGNSTSFVSTNNIQTAKLSRTENNYLYCGEQFDRTTGLYYLRARYMNPRIGTFITQDAYAGSIFDPVSLHKYLYANANPVTYKDPSGYFTLAEVSVSMSISTTLREAHATAMFSGLLNALHTFMSGGSQGDVLNSFFGGIGAGYLFGGVGKLAQIGPMMKGFMGVYSLGGIGMGYLQAYEDFEKGNQQAGTLMLITSSIGVVGWAKAYFPKDVASKFGSILKDKSGQVGKSDGGESNNEYAESMAQYQRLKESLSQKEIQSLIKTTEHGAERLLARGFTSYDINDLKLSPSTIMTQSDGAKVYIKDVGGKLNVIVESENGIVTALKNISPNSLSRLAKNYGWK